MQKGTQETRSNVGGRRIGELLLEVTARSHREVLYVLLNTGFFLCTHMSDTTSSSNPTSILCPSSSLSTNELVSDRLDAALRQSM